MVVTWPRLLYVVLALLRFLLAFLPGYIHPDEFFQSQEVSAPAVLSLQGLIPWEFQGKSPARSCIAPFVTSGVPFLILKSLPAITGLAALSSASLLYAPRLFMVLLSFIIDLAAWRLCDAADLPRGGLLVLASCWPVLILQGRPFSNSLEHVTLALACLVAISRRDPTTGNRWGSLHRCVALGCVAAAGIFVRFTFLFYAIPLGLLVALEPLCEELGCMWKEWRPMVRRVCAGILGFVGIAGIIVVADSLYFGHAIFTVEVGRRAETGAEAASLPRVDVRNLTWQELQWDQLMSMRFEGGLVVTPWNSLRYNINRENLALHGLHPRFLHAMVNLPMLFGPVAVAAALGAGTSLLCQLSSASSAGQSSVGKPHKSAHVSLREKHVRMALTGCIVIPLVLLSAAPHQEPRFLLPMALPMCLLFGHIVSRSKSLLALWILFNAVAATFFGALHQGGLTTSLNFLFHHTRSPLSLVPLLASLTHSPTPFPSRKPPHSPDTPRAECPLPSGTGFRRGLEDLYLSKGGGYEGAGSCEMGRGEGGSGSEGFCSAGEGGCEHGVCEHGGHLEAGETAVEIIFFQTYMPPRSLLVLPLEGASHGLPLRVKVTDINGGDTGKLHEAILAPLWSPATSSCERRGPQGSHRGMSLERETSGIKGTKSRLWVRSSNAKQIRWVLKLVVSPATAPLEGPLRNPISNCTVHWSLAKKGKGGVGRDRPKGHGEMVETRDGLRTTCDANLLKSPGFEGCTSFDGSGCEVHGEVARECSCSLTLSLLKDFGMHVSTEEMGQLVGEIGRSGLGSLWNLLRLNIHGILFQNSYKV